MAKTFKDFYLKEQTGRKIGLFPGSFKPPHKGHFNNIKYFADQVDDLYVIVSEPSEKSARKTPAGKKVTGKKAAEVLEQYIDKLPLKNVEVIVNPQPVKYVLDFLKEQTNPGDQVLLGVGGVGDDAKRFAMADKYTPEGVTFNISEAPMTPGEPGSKLSATDFREILDDLTIEKLMPYIPDEFKDNRNVVMSVYNILKNLE